MVTRKTTKKAARKVVVFARPPQGGNRIIYGTLESHDKAAKTAIIADARMCIFYSRETGGELGLAAIGPQAGSRISAVAPRVEVEGVVQIADVSDVARSKWEAP